MEPIDWDEMDQAYLDIFGTHPELSAPAPTVTAMTTGTVEPELEDDAQLLTELEKEILEFERSWWKYSGARDTAIRERWDISPTRYSQIVVVLIDEPAALAHDPLTVKRLRRLRDARRAQRSASRG